jgi:hypothetical protein
VASNKTTKVLNLLRNKPYLAPNQMELPNNSGDHQRSIKRNTPTGDQDLVNKEYVDKDYGEIYIANSSASQSIPTGTYTQLLLWTGNGQYYKTTPDSTQGHITVNTSGNYLVTMSVAFSGDASVEWTGGVRTNNGTVAHANLETHRKLGAGGDVGSASISGIAPFTDGDTVEIWFKHLAGVNKSIVVKDCTLSILKIN